MIADAMDKVGRDGVITIELHNAVDTELEVVEGLRFDRGLHLAAVRDQRRPASSASSRIPFILVYEAKISSLQEFVPLLEQVIGTGRPLLVIAEKVEGDALSALVINKMRGALKCCAVEPPGYGSIRKEELQDVAAFVGAKPIMEGIGVPLAEVKLADLGRAKRVVVDLDDTTIFGGGGSRELIDGRINVIKKTIAASNSEWDKGKLQERLAKLSGGVALIKVGGHTELEMNEVKARIEDALAATRAAVEEGLVPGGGVAYVRCIDALDELKFDRRAPVRRRRRAPRARGAAAADRAQHGRRSLDRRAQGARRQGRLRLQRRDRRLRGPRQGGRRRPGEGRARGAAERGVGRGPAAHDRGHDGRAGEGRVRARLAPAEPAPDMPAPRPRFREDDDGPSLRRSSPERRQARCRMRARRAREP